jgi:SAM-dependent methyltransferase
MRIRRWVLRSLEAEKPAFSLFCRTLALLVYIARLVDNMASPDKSNGYEEIAPDYIAARGQNSSGIGASVVAEWSKTLPRACTVLDLGCGNGVPISQVLIERGLNVRAIDASPRMVAAFRSRFPNVPVECAAVEDCNFFGMTFDAVVAWGLFFLLDAPIQLNLIQKISTSLKSGGHFLFTAPSQICTWLDSMTDRTSFGLGRAAYQQALESASMSLIATATDKGENHCYFAQKT